MSRKSPSSPGNERDGSTPSLHYTASTMLFPSLGQGSPYQDEQSPALSAVNFYLLENRNVPISDAEIASSHAQISSYTYPEPILIIPNTSRSSDSPPINSRSLPVRPRSESLLQTYQLYGNYYSNASNTPGTYVHEDTEYPPFGFTFENDLHLHSQPPTPHSGLYNVSPASALLPARQINRPIAPQPERSLSAPKRQFDDHPSNSESKRNIKRHSVTRTYIPVERKFEGLNSEEHLLVHLKEDLKLPWKEITARFERETGFPKQEAALQMRYKRLKERVRVWTPGDLRALAKAVQKADNMRWEAISQAMLSFGVQEKWTRQACQAKWESLDEHELETVRELDWSTSQQQYDDQNSSHSSTGSATPESLRSEPGYKGGLGIAPSQPLMPQGDDRLYRCSQDDWLYVAQGV